MVTIKNAAPRAILNGIKDESGRAPVYQPEARPSHMPHVFLFAQRGTLEPQVVVAAFGIKISPGQKRFSSPSPLPACMRSR